ncbi:MAG: Flp pilus assembly protein CpaB [Anaerolineae bacterium]|nr:Flp pilus assembly protein CpaB [Anaerolineae bacterium]
MKRKGAIWLAVGLVLAVMAGLATFRILTQVTAERETGAVETTTSSVVVALVDMEPRTILTDTTLALRQVPIEMVPVGAVTNLDEARGKLTLDEVSAGEIILSRRLADPSNTSANIAFTMPEDKVAIALPGGDRLTRSGVLKEGDRVDLLFSLSASSSSGGKADTLVTLSAIQNLTITAIVLPNVLAEASGSTLGKVPGSSGATGDIDPILLVAVDPQDALVLKYLVDAGAVLDVALRANTNEQIRAVESVTIEYMADRYQFVIPKENTQPLKPSGKE